MERKKHQYFFLFTVKILDKIPDIDYNWKISVHKITYFTTAILQLQIDWFTFQIKKNVSIHSKFFYIYIYIWLQALLKMLKENLKMLF